MAHTLPNRPDGIVMEQVLAALAQLGIVPTPEQNSRLNNMGGGGLIPVVTGVTISTPGGPRVSLPVVVIESDSEDDVDFPGYPLDNSSDSDEESPTTHDPISSPAQPDVISASMPGTDAAPDTSSRVDKPQPGVFKCTICGNVFDVTLQ